MPAKETFGPGISVFPTRTPTLRSPFLECSLDFSVQNMEVEENGNKSKKHKGSGRGGILEGSFEEFPLL